MTSSAFTAPLIGCAQPSAVESLMGPQSCVNLTGRGGARIAHRHSWYVGAGSQLCVIPYRSGKSPDTVWGDARGSGRCSGPLRATLDSICRVAFATFCGSEPDQPQYRGGGKDCHG